ncbi:TPA: hypothetical protein ACH3X2_007070 [Trebouxia sp. C0005]
MAEDDVAIQQESVSLRLGATQRSDGSPSHKRVRLSLSSALFSSAADQHMSPLATAVLTTTPDLFDATPGEATGVQPGRRKSSRSRVYSHRSSGGSSKNKSNRASTGAKAEDILPDPLRPQLRLSNGANQRDSHEASVCFPASATLRASSLSPEDGTKNLSVPVQAEQATSLSSLPNPQKDNALFNCSFTKDSNNLLRSQHADKENLLMGVHVPRFNMIERAMVLALNGKLTKEAYKYKVSDLLAWTSTMLNTNNVKSCTEQEMLAVLQTRDSEECVMLSAQNGADVVYIM